MKKISIFSIVFTCLLVVAGCSPAVTTKDEAEPPSQPLPEKARMVNLVWKPTMQKDDLDLAPLAVFTPLSTVLVSVADVRKDIRLIGKAYEDRKVRTVFIPIATKVNVARWWKSGIEKVFTEMGLKHDGKKGNLKLEFEITAFSIFDDFTQTGTATRQVSAHTDGELLIWEGQINGTSDLYVHATESDGISECLSNTVMVTVHNLFTDASFRDAVIKAFE